MHHGRGRTARVLLRALGVLIAGAACLLEPSRGHALPADALPADALPADALPTDAATVDPAAGRADLDTLLHTFEAVHPDLYRHTSRKAVRRRQAVIERQLDASMSRRAFAVAVARLAASFQDGHTRVDLPLDAYEAAARAGARTFPVRVASTDDGLRVRNACGTAALPERARLLSINGRDAAVLFQTVQAVLPGTAAYREAVAGDQFPWLLWMHEVEAPFRVVYTLPGRATTHTATLLGIDFPTVRRCLAPDPTPPYTFARRAGVGIITMHRMAQPQRFNRFLARVADSLEQRPAEGLIVDLRPCPGGRTRVARLVVGALTDVPFRLVARKDWKVSAAYKAFLRARAGPQHPYLRQPEGRVVSVKYKATAPPDPPLRYRGPVAVLVGPRTFSGAVTLAATLKANGRAAIVGRETGGRVHRFGEGYTFRLPHTGLRAMVSSAYFEHASRPRDWSGGLVPDIMVDAPLGTESDVALGVALARMRRLATTP